MTASATAPAREKAERARENSEYVCSLLNVRQPQFAAALEAAARKPLRDHGTVCASSQRSSQPGWGLLAGAGRPAALPAGQTCELRVGPEVFYLGSDAGTLTVRRGPAPGGDAVVAMPAGTLYSLLTGQATVTDTVRHATVDGEHATYASGVLGPTIVIGAGAALLFVTLSLGSLLLGIWLIIFPPILDHKHPIAHAMYWSNSFSGGVLIALAAAGLGFAALRRTAR